MEAKLITDNGEVLENEFPLDKLPLVLGRGCQMQSACRRSVGEPSPL